MRCCLDRLGGRSTKRVLNGIVGPPEGRCREPEGLPNSKIPGDLRRLWPCPSGRVLSTREGLAGGDDLTPGELPKSKSAAIGDVSRASPGPHCPAYVSGPKLYRQCSARTHGPGPNLSNPSRNSSLGVGHLVSHFTCPPPIPSPMTACDGSSGTMAPVSLRPS